MHSDIIELTAPDQKTQACREIIETLPAWFGRPEANDYYARAIATKDVFAAMIDHDVVGLIALAYHFGTTADIWWMGIKLAFHRRGLGAQLFSTARARALDKGCQWMVVETVSPRSADVHYAGTRAFYGRMGFDPLLEARSDDPANPMMWMIRKP